MPQNKPNNSQGAVSLANKAASKNPSPTGAVKQNKKTQKRKTIIGILVSVIVAMLLFLIIGGIVVYRAISTPKRNVEKVELKEHFTTPAAYSDKVGYYVIGLMGKEISDPSEMLSILAFDKVNKTVNILQLPQDTYLGDTDQWAVKRASEVFGNPKPLKWCSTCRRVVKDNEIQDGKHAADNPPTPITSMPGSASEDLCGVFNTLLGLPVDGYFMIPQNGFVKLVNLLGGIDVDLESDMSVQDIDYKKGVQTLDGNAALYYVTNRKSGITGDIDRMVKQRKVFAAIFQRLSKQSKDKLTNDSIGPLMNGSTPIRTDFDRTKMIDLIVSMSKVQPSSMTAYIMPGRIGWKDGVAYYAPFKSTLLTRLNQSFCPAGNAVTEADIKVTELGSGKAMDTHKQVLSDVIVNQSGAITTTAEATTTTKAS